MNHVEVDLAEAARAALADELAAAMPEVVPFRFGAAPAQPAMRLAGIDRLGERICRQLRAAIEPMARVKTQVAAAPIRALSFEEWRGGLPGFASITQYRLLPLKGGALVALEPAFVTRLVDAFYGGSGKPAKDRPREFTPTEDRLLARLPAAVADALVAAWGDVAALERALVGHETNPSYISFVRGGEQVVVQPFTVTPGAAPSATISIVYTAAGRRPVAPPRAARGAGGGGRGRSGVERPARGGAGKCSPARTLGASPAGDDDVAADGPEARRRDPGDPPAARAADRGRLPPGDRHAW